MSSVRHHNPALQQRLEHFLAAADYGGLLKVLDALGATDFRTAGYLLAEVVLPALSGAAFWDAFVAVVPHHPKAYLGTFLKAAARLYGCGTIDFRHSGFRRFATTEATAVDRRKTLDALLPLLRTPEEVSGLLDLFGVEAAARVVYLFRAGTKPCYFRLFVQLKALDDAALVGKYCRLLMQRGDRLSFNLAALLKHYFALEKLGGTFSLRLRPYEHSRLDASYTSFEKLLTSV